MRTKKKKGMGPISTIAPVVLAVVIAVFITAMGAQMLGQLNDTQTANSYEANITLAGLEGLSQFSDWWTIIILAVILGIVVGVLFLYLGGTLGGQGGAKF